MTLPEEDAGAFDVDEPPVEELPDEELVVDDVEDEPEGPPIAASESVVAEFGGGTPDS